MTSYIVLGSEKNFLGWVYGDSDAQAEVNLQQGGGARSTFGEAPYWIINVQTEKWIAVHPPYTIPDDWVEC